MSQSEYAKAGVDNKKIGLFKDVMKSVSARTRDFPNFRDVIIEPSAHGAGFEYIGSGGFKTFATKEGLGNKNWLAEWMYQRTDDVSYFAGIGGDTALMAVNDLIASGAMPIMYLDEVAAGDSDWFADAKRAHAIGESFYEICSEVGMALPAGESPSLRYLVKAEPPVKSAPVMSGTAVGIIAPATRQITGKVEVGDLIIGFGASGVHCNGISSILKRGLTLPDQFFTKLPNGKTLGEETLIRTRSYVLLVDALLNSGVTVNRFLPGTGGGVAKLAVCGDFTYRIHWWPQIPVLVEFMRELGMTNMDSLTTFNCGIGYYAFVPRKSLGVAIKVAKNAGYEAHSIGRVEEGARGVIFGPENDIFLPHPEE